MDNEAVRAESAIGVCCVDCEYVCPRADNLKEHEAQRVQDEERWTRMGLPVGYWPDEWVVLGHDEEWTCAKLPTVKCKDRNPNGRCDLFKNGCVELKSQQQEEV
jgi:hypothetical protein